ncbi:MAG: GAF domain-containing sensor histidine kinase [Anaerolineae bacterium]|nr:GAF domain-containing sensor histidine kinase [Anaerolineae bacterium]
MLSLQRQIQGLMRLNQSLADIQDENTLMNITLQIITEVSGATAVSFVTLDEWGQTLPAFAQGSLPEAMLKGWAEHVISERARSICKVCYDREAQPGKSCPLLQGPFLDHFGVFCLPLQRGEQLLGMLNLYYPAGEKFSSELRSFLQGLLNVLIVAISSIRLREQARATLKHIQMARNDSVELTGPLAGLIHNLRQVMNSDYIRLQTRELETGQTMIKLEDGVIPDPGCAALDQIADNVFRTGKPFSENKEEAALAGFSLWALPLEASDGRILGVIMAAGKHLALVEEHQQRVMKIVADQLVSVLEMERYLLSLEYKMVIQERSRLAREIHDGLAQTLAYLKLQTAQMQTLLKQKDTLRLGAMLELNYQALSEAYLDTRQAIDQLRLKPEQSLLDSLEQVAEIFEENSDIVVERNFALPERNVSPEIQAQLIRIVQEALSNVRKHAKTRHVVIAVKAWEGDIILEVQDDGVGFQPQDLFMVDQHGLRGMSERAELIGADFQVESSPQRGTIVRLRLPLVDETNV